MNLDVTHAWLQLLVCHNSLKSVLCETKPGSSAGNGASTFIWETANVQTPHLRYLITSLRVSRHARHEGRGYVRGVDPRVRRFYSALMRLDSNRKCRTSKCSTKTPSAHTSCHPGSSESAKLLLLNDSDESSASACRRDSRGEDSSDLTSSASLSGERILSS